MANRESCDVHILDYFSKREIMYIDFANLTTSGFETNSIYAYLKQSQFMKYDMSTNGTLSISFQVHPFKLYSLFTENNISHEAIVVCRETITASTNYIGLKNGYVNGTLCVKDVDTLSEINGQINDGLFISDNLVIGHQYIITYLQQKTTVNKISFDNLYRKNLFYIQMNTLYKDDSGELIPVYIVSHKASLVKTLDLTFSSNGDPAEITLQFDCLVDENGKCLDIIELTDDNAEIEVPDEVIDYSKNLWTNFDTGNLETDLDIFSVQNDYLYVTSE